MMELTPPSFPEVSSTDLRYFVASSSELYFQLTSKCSQLDLSQGFGEVNPLLTNFPLQRKI